MPKQAKSHPWKKHGQKRILKRATVERASGKIAAKQPDYHKEQRERCRAALEQTATPSGWDVTRYAFYNPLTSVRHDSGALEDVAYSAERAANALLLLLRKLVGKGALTMDEAIDVLDAAQ